MSATGLDIIIEQGSTYTLVHTAPKSLSGATARMKLRRQHGLTDQVLSLVSPTNIVLTVQGNTTTITVTISATDTAGLAAPGVSANGVYDLETELSGVVERHLEGMWFLSPEVTA
jgi:hypothetical protein